MKKNPSLKLALAFAGTLTLAGCVVPGPEAYQPVPPPMMAVTQPGVVETAYIAPPGDVYVNSAVDRDIVFVGGNTYIWFVGPDGVRHRHLYGRGDLRAEVFHRREELRFAREHHEDHRPGGPAYDHSFPGHGADHFPEAPYAWEPHPPMQHPGPGPGPQHAGPQPVMPAHGPQPLMPQMHVQAQLQPQQQQVHPQPQTQPQVQHPQQQPAPHVTTSSAHHPKEGG